MVQNWYSCKVPFIVCQILMKRESLGRFSKNPELSISMKIRPVGAEFYADGHTYGRTDRHDEANSHFSLYFEPASKPHEAKF
jgi:hypothetical protein